MFPSHDLMLRPTQYITSGQYDSIEFGITSSIYSELTGPSISNVNIATNLADDGSTRYAKTGAAADISLGIGGFVARGYPSGTAGEEVDTPTTWFGYVESTGEFQVSDHLTVGDAAFDSNVALAVRSRRAFTNVQEWRASSNDIQRAAISEDANYGGRLLLYVGTVSSPLNEGDIGLDLKGDSSSAFLGPNSTLGIGAISSHERFHIENAGIALNQYDWAGQTEPTDQAGLGKLWVSQDAGEEGALKYKYDIAGDDQYSGFLTNNVAYVSTVAELQAATANPAIVTGKQSLPRPA